VFDKYKISNILSVRKLILIFIDKKSDEFSGYKVFNVWEV